MASLLTSGPLPAHTFTAGTPGVNEDSLTMNANGALMVDGFTFTGSGDALFVKDEATASNNGKWFVSVPGDGTHQAVLTRTGGAPLVGDEVSPDAGIANKFTAWEAFSVSTLNQNCYVSGAYKLRLVSPQIVPGFLGGFFVANNAGSPNTKLDIAAGFCADSSSVVVLYGDSRTKDVSAAWAAGDGNGGLFSGSVASSTTYHVFAILNDTDRSVDYGFDTSVTAANRPSGYTYFRRIGSVLTDASAHIVAFHQYGDEFYLDTSVKDVDVTNPGTSAVTRTLTVPTGIQVCAIFAAVSWDSTGDTVHYVSSLDAADEVPSYANCIESAPSDKTGEGVSLNRIWTNTSARIRTRLSFSAATTAFKIRTRGWIDTRGKN